MSDAVDPFGAPSFLETDAGARIAYHCVAAAPEQEDRPGVVFLGGFNSDMTGTKAVFLHRWAERCGRAFLRFDYQGHGQSSGRFADGTIGRWTADAEAAVRALTKGPQILVGSSMGGWIMLLVALRLIDREPEQVAGLVGIAAAPDFTEDLMWNRFDRAVRTALLTEGVWQRPSPYDPEGYPITRALIEEGRHHLLLRDPIGLYAPVHLLQGMQDEDVPWQTAVRLSERLAGDHVTVELIKDGDHRLSRDEDLARLERAVSRIE